MAGNHRAIINFQNFSNILYIFDSSLQDDNSSSSFRFDVFLLKRNLKSHHNYKINIY
jgi:hypothetical protein